jgi:hypothetical protein
LTQTRETPDGYSFNYGNLESDLLKQQIAAEDKRTAIVDAEEAANSWRKGWTDNTGDVFPYGLVQVRSRDHDQSYKSAYDTLADSIKTTHKTAEQKRQDAVDAQENADAWRYGVTASSGPVLSLHQRRAIPDGYTFNFDNLKDSIKTTHDTAESARQAAVSAQESADAWRKGSTPNSGPVLSLNQHRETPDGYTVNFDNLEAAL